MSAYADRDKILLTGLAFYGYHGVMLEENKLGQRFRIDLEIGLDMRAAARSDHVEDTISYAHLYDVVKAAFDEKRFKLLEALAQHIIARMMGHFDKIEWVRITVRKPEAPLPIVAGEAAIEMVRERGRL